MTAHTLPAAAPPLKRDAQLIGLVGLAHLISHFSQLLLAPLFPWLKDAFNASYTELGFLMTLFFVVSCAVQMAAGFMVDRFGPRPILFGGLALLGVSAFGFAASPNYAVMAAFSVLAGVGNGVFHPVDYTLLNRKVSAPRLGHAYSVHGVTGSLGWALAPAMLVPVALAYSWRHALVCAGFLAFAVLALLLAFRDQLELPSNEGAGSRPTPIAPAAEGSFAFLRIPAVWMCFTFFFFYAISLSVVQLFAPAAARQLHDMPLPWVATCLSVYMLCSAAGMVIGGFLAANPERCERVVGAGFGAAAAVALVLGFVDMSGWMVLVLFGVMGCVVGTAGPSRDLIVKRAAPANATGRVYGVVYSGLDIGQAVAPLLFGVLMDHGHSSGIFVGLALVQALLITSAFNVRRVRRTV